MSVIPSVSNGSGGGPHECSRFAAPNHADPSLPLGMTLYAEVPDSLRQLLARFHLGQQTLDAIVALQRFEAIVD